MQLLFLGKLRRVLTICILTQVSLSAAIPAADVNRGFDHFYNLEFDQAIDIFRSLTRRFPAEPAACNHLAQAILYREMLRAGALETELVSGGNAFLRRPEMNPSPADEAEFFQSIRRSIELSRQLSQANPANLDATYTLGIAYGIRANYNFVVRKAWLDALRDATTARKLHNSITDRNPSYIDARLTQGVHDYIIGSLPWTYRLLSFLTGFHADKEQGIRTVEMVYRQSPRLRDDAAILLATVYRRERRPADAVPLLEDLIARYPRNYLLRFELAQMYSDLGNKQQALQAIDAVQRLKQLGSPGFALLPLEKILYYRATVQFWYNDLDDALQNFSRVTAHAHLLDPNTGVTAWMRLGQTYDLKGDRRRAIDAYRQTIAYAPGSYRAKEAESYLRQPYQRKRN